MLRMRLPIPLALPSFGPLLVIALVALTGACTHPCDALQERLCTDLGPQGCATFRASPSAFGGFVPDAYGWSKRHNGIDQCQLFGDDANYLGHTLPQTRYLVALRSNPSTPAPQLQPIDSSGGSMSGPWLYALMPLSVLGILVYSWHARKKLMQQYGQGGPQAPGDGPAS